METYKKDDAFMLYTEGGMALNEISSLLNVSVSTLYKWSSAGKWERVLESEASMHATIRTGLMHECEKLLDLIERQERTASKREAEMIKRISMLTKRQNEVMHYSYHMATLTRFNNNIIHVDLNFAKELLKCERPYIKQLKNEQGMLKD